MLARSSRPIVTRPISALSVTRAKISSRANFVAPQMTFDYRTWATVAAAGLLGAFFFADDKKYAECTTIPFTGAPGTKNERTFIAIKPDGVQRALVGEVIKRFEAKGYKLVAIKIIHPSAEFAAEHYSDLSTKPFFKGLVSYFSSGPVVAMVWEGYGSIAGGRALVGATNPKDALPGSLRGDLAIDVGRNIIHGSDSPDSAKHEIAHWFKPEELVSYVQNNEKWIVSA